MPSPGVTRHRSDHKILIFENEPYEFSQSCEDFVSFWQIGNKSIYNIVYKCQLTYRHYGQTSDISLALVGNKIVDYSYVVEASPGPPFTNMD